jgi:hypothetical protein
MDPLGTMQAFGDFWTNRSRAFFEGQQKWFGDLVKVTLGDKTAFAALQPDTSGFEAAQRAYATSLESAMDLSAALMKGLPQIGRSVNQADTMLLPVAMFDPQAWSAFSPDLEGSFARLQEGPQLADSGQTERKFAAVYTAMVAVRQRNLEHQMVMTNAWARAANAFTRRLGASSEAEQGRQASWSALTAIWIEVANDELLATQRSETYLTSQRNLLKASTDLRLAQQQVAAFYGEMFGLPTRAEIEDVHKTVTELRREVRALKRSQKTAQEPNRG